jgi:glycopeptide antibiotics resistance protein
MPVAMKSRTRTRLLDAAILIGTLPMIVLVMYPHGGATRKVFLVPLVDLAGQFGIGPGYAALQIGGNLLVFAAFGFFGPIRWRLGLVGVTAIAAAGSAVLEILQYLIETNRVTSVDDVLVNAAGAALFALVSRRYWAIFPEVLGDRAPLGVNDRSGRG